MDVVGESEGAVPLREGSRGDVAVLMEEAARDAAGARGKRRVAAMHRKDNNKKKNAQPTGGSGGLFHCNYCARDITREMRVRCEVCADFDLCAYCFSIGVEIDDHKNNHGYRVIERMRFPLLTADWGANEEMLLLEGIELNGLGNWTGVAGHVGTKTAGQCAEHYMQCYVRQPNHLPDLRNVLSDANSRFTEARSVTPPPAERDVSGPNEETGLTSMFALAPLPPLSGLKTVLKRDDEEEADEKERKKEKDKKKGKKDHLTLPDSGYHLYRDEFTYWHEETAEDYISHMEFPEGIPAWERDLLVKVLEVYNFKLNERARRKKFATDRGLLYFKKLQAAERRRTKEGKEVHGALRPFARFLSQDEFEQLVDGITAERLQRTQIEELKEHRSCGITDHDQVAQYLADKKKRETDLAARREKQAMSYLYSTEKKTSRAQRWLSRDTNDPSFTAPAVLGAPPAKKRANLSAEIPIMPAAELLTPQEHKLCAQQRLLPTQYLVVKDTLLREDFRVKGELKKSNARAIVQIDPKKVGHIYEFMANAGWVGQAVAPPGSPVPQGDAMEIA